MNVLYVEAIRKNIETKSPYNSQLKKLPKNLFVTYTIQYRDFAKKVKDELLKKGHKIKGFKQVLGCSKLKSKCSILFIGSGKFHYINLALQNSYPIYIYNIDDFSLSILDNKQIDFIKNKRKLALNKFLYANRIGIMVSTKPGQNKINEAIKLKKHLEKNGKEVFLFLSNQIKIEELENFQIDSWINTACPGIINDSGSVLNIEEVPKLQPV